MVKYIWKTATKYVWIPHADLSDVIIYINKKFPNIKIKSEFHSNGYYLVFTNKITALRIQKQLVKEGFFKFYKIKRIR